MRVIICKDRETSAALVAQEILNEMTRKPDLLLGLATGSTPLGVYKKLVQAHRERTVDFSRLRTCNLDEYVGLAEDHPQSYRHFMRTNFFEPLGLPMERTLFPPTEGPGLEAQCEAFEDRLAEMGGIDIQVLGLGSNGHIGFNEPTSSLASRTRLKTLTEKTLSDNARFYAQNEKQPGLASTMGIGTILSARRIILQAFGTHKAKAVQAAIEGPVMSLWPVSALQLHPKVVMYLDEDAAELLTMRAYLRQVRENEEDIQKRGAL